ncbi:MAG: 2-oxoglutarate dehydrogenase E1 component, partial [Verrucomicrobia bacterium 21-51-4]
MKHLSAANRWNADLIDQQYNTWLNAPETLDAQWRAFFEGFTLAQSCPKPGKAGTASPAVPSVAQFKILAAIAAYRTLGHLQAPEALGLSEADLQVSYHTGDFLGGQTLRGKEIFKRLEAIYCGPVGVEIMHIQDKDKRSWWMERLEAGEHAPKYTAAQKKQMLQKVSNAEVFEHFLHTRFVGAKRFSIEGGEALLAAMDRLIEACPANGVQQIVLGMAHRGRLAMLTNVLGKPFEKLFREFTEGYMPEGLKGDGDVKYHMGFDNMHPTTAGKEVRLTLAANPSHLEFVDAVVEGCVRARQELTGELGKRAVLPLLLHGDAAMIGQGVVAETLNIARLKGYGCGGTLHIVINNQIGFTTNPEDARSTRYCSDIAKMIEAPVFHVNGDDPMALARLTELSLEYRQAFGEDVVIDFICYRKYGHNETDEPGFTQPTLYK